MKVSFANWYKFNYDDEEYKEEHHTSEEEFNKMIDSEGYIREGHEFVISNWFIYPVLNIAFLISNLVLFTVSLNKVYVVTGYPKDSASYFTQTLPMQPGTKAW